MRRIEKIAHEAALKAVMNNGALVDDQRYAIADASAAVAYAIGRSLQLAVRSDGFAGQITYVHDAVEFLMQEMDTVQPEDPQ